MRAYKVKVSTTGSAGSASGAVAQALDGPGRLMALYVQYHASAPATTDLTVKSLGDPASRTLLTLTNTNTSAWYSPSAQAHDSTGALVTGAQMPPVLHAGILEASLAQCDALTDAVIVWAFVEH